MFSGLRDVEAGDDAEVDLGNGFSLVKPNDYLLSARNKFSMTGLQWQESVEFSRYIIYSYEPLSLEPPSYLAKTYEEMRSAFLCGLMALQMLKPIQTQGLLFFCQSYDAAHDAHSELLAAIEHRPPMKPGPWAIRRRFDQELLKLVPAAIESVKQVMNGLNAERRNAFMLLQLGLEHFHPLIAGLLWVMGLEALCNSANRNDFKKKLCDYLGPSTSAFPDWNVNSPPDTVEDIALHLYTLRSKLAHGVDLRKAAADKKSPVDLLQTRTLPDSPDPVSYASFLSEASCYLLCQALQKEIAAP
jgi:hypothetical protein